MKHQALPKRSAAEIAAELRREFELALHARYGTQPTPDPVLATLFHSLAVQVARVYEEADRVFPVAVFDDLIDGLGMPPRIAQPAQCVVRFAGVEHRELATPETELFGFSRGGEQVGFTLDETIELSTTELAFAGVYEDGRLHVLAGARAPGQGPFVQPGSVPHSLGRAAPTLFLAFDADVAHLSGLGLFFEVFAPASPVLDALQRSAWQLLDSQGRVNEAGMLRARTGRGGVQRLEWFHGRPDAEGARGGVADAFALAEGAYGRQVWIFPDVPAERRFRSGVPEAIAPVLPRLVPDGAAHAWSRPLVWLQVPLPVGTRGVANAIQRVHLNCVTASNIEIWSETVRFDRLGSVVALRPEGRTDRHVMGVLSVIGESGTPYAEEADVQAPLEHGRFSYRNGRLSLRPASGPTGRLDTYAMVRLLFCDGARANGLEIGDLRRIASSLANVTASVANLTVSRGGAAPPDYAGARTRFAATLRTRERVVTAADLEVAARAFEPRVRAVGVEASAEMTPSGLQQVGVVTIGVRRADFADPEAELVRLRAALESHLQERAILGHRIVVRVTELG